jgi:hypothetical protein
MSNITSLDIKPDDRKALIERLKRDLQDQIELDRLFAKYRRSQFEAYVGEGFTPDQALKLVIGPPMVHQ